MTDEVQKIYHLVPEPALRAQLDRSIYRPAALADDGFVHCSLRASLLPVANGYFAQAPQPPLVLELDVERLTAEVRFEDAAPVAGGGGVHLESATVFPHVYGPIDRAAITGVGALGRDGSGYRWPECFESLERFIAGAKSELDP
jgi:uncharacterized protein (DUF952 family)